MPAIAMTFGVLLIILGAGTYVGTGAKSMTALIPAYFGIFLGVCGVIALNAKMRMHAMHGAALLGLLGFGMPAFRVIKHFVSGSNASSTAVAAQAAMSVLCLVFLILCIRSFIAARRARSASVAVTSVV